MSVLGSHRFQLLANTRLSGATGYGEEGRGEILSRQEFESARREITSWSGYSPTPLRRLTGLARELGIKEIYYKDEGARFGLNSFKALGGAYAVFRLIQREIERKIGKQVSGAEIISGAYKDYTFQMTVTCATDGNHGRSVAWGAKLFGCRCVIYVHEMVSEARCKAIERYGAEVRRVIGNYDDAVREADQDAKRYGWFVVSDTSYEGYVSVPRDVMQGYTIMVDEALQQISLPTTHVFVQGGVGGLAAAVCAHLWQHFGNKKPIFVVVEPEKADCIYRSALAGKATAVKGPLDTIMAGLACGEVSLLAWQILQSGADAFMTIADEPAAEMMRILADGRYGDEPIVAGESAVAGLVGLTLAATDKSARSKLALESSSVALLFGTEGATDEDIYRQIVGRSSEEVRAAA